MFIFRIILLNHKSML